MDQFKVGSRCILEESVSASEADALTRQFQGFMDNAATEGGAAGRRRSKRFPIPYTFHLTPIGHDDRLLSDETTVVVGKDLSCSGISFSHDQSLPYRRAVIVLNPRLGRFAMEVEIVWSFATPLGLYEYGCRLIQTLSGCTPRRIPASRNRVSENRDSLKTNQSNTNNKLCGMGAIGYLHKKIIAAVETLCSDEGCFEQRMYDAWGSALVRLQSDNPPAEIAEELNMVLSICRQHIVEGSSRFTKFSGYERRRIGSNLVNVLNATSRLTGSDK